MFECLVCPSKALQRGSCEPLGSTLQRRRCAPKARCAPHRTHSFPTDRCCIHNGTSCPRTIRHFHDRERSVTARCDLVTRPRMQSTRASDRPSASIFLAAPCAQKPRVATDTCVIRPRHRDDTGLCSQRRLCGLATTHVIQVERPATWMPTPTSLARSALRARREGAACGPLPPGQPGGIWERS
jgi:hypothetical protein